MSFFKIRQYILCSFIFVSMLTISWLIPNIFIIDNISNDNPLALSEFEIFLNIMGGNCNFLSYNRIMALYLLVYVFVLNYFSNYSKTIYYIIRLKSRAAYLKKCVFHAIGLALIITVLIEFTNIIFSLIFFGFKLTIQSDLMVYSVYDFMTEFLFYMRAGVLLLITEILFDRKIAPFVTFAIYFSEYFTKDYLPILNNVWLPYKDCVQVTDLIMRSTQIADIAPMVVRGIMINILLIVLSYYLLSRKDLIEHEKR